VEELLKKNPKLALAAGTVTDLSDRTFKGITVFQYAAWALDIEMCEVILKYLAGSAAVQLKALETHPDVYSAHGAHYDLMPLINKLQAYVYEKTGWSKDQRKKYWEKEVGGAQRQCPAWLVYMWCEEGKNVAWLNKEEWRSFPRQYTSKHLGWWWNKEFSGGKGVGSTWAACRGSETELNILAFVTYANEPAYDSSVVQKLKVNRAEFLGKLRDRLTQQCSQEHTISIQTSNAPALFQPVPTKQTTTAWEQVKEQAQRVAKQVHGADFQALLKWVTEGHLVEVEELLKKNPKLALAAGTVTDLSDRMFIGITVFQYAAWALDIEMCEVILKYLAGPIAAVQLKALETHPDVYSVYGAHYDFTSLINKTQTYMQGSAKGNWDQREKYWQKEVGGAQRQCPAWLVYMWCEEGKDVAWAKQYQSFTRQYAKAHINWWWTKEFNGGKGVGSTWGAQRGKKDRVHADQKALGIERPGYWNFSSDDFDIAMNKKVKENRMWRLGKLRDRLTQEHQNNTLIVPSSVLS